MAVIALTSASGSPGVTTTALGLALLWPRPVAAGRGRPDRRLRNPRRLLPRVEGVRRRADRARAVAGRRSRRAAERRPRDRRLQCVVRRRHPISRPGRRTAGPVGTTGRRAGRPRRHGSRRDRRCRPARTGRVRPSRCSRHADLTLLLTRTSLPALAAARSWAERIRRDREWREPGSRARRRGPALPSHEVAKVLGHTGHRDDGRRSGRGRGVPRGAAPPRSFDSGPLVRSLHAAIGLDPGPGGAQHGRAARGGLVVTSERWEEWSRPDDVCRSSPTLRRPPASRSRSQLGEPPRPTRSRRSSARGGRLGAGRGPASAGLRAAQPGRRGRPGRLDKTAQEELGRSIVLDLIESSMADAVNAGGAAWTLAEQDALARAVFDSLFRLGRLQPLVDDDRVENIIIAGHDNVMLELIDGSLLARTAGGRLRRGADRLPGLPRLPQRGQRPRASPRPSHGCTCASTAAPGWPPRPG